MAQVDYRPLNAEVTLSLPKIEEKTKGGIIKSDEMIQKEREKFSGAALVIHCGPNVPRNADGEPQIVPGDKVLLRNGAMLSDIKIGGMNLQQVDSYNILGVIKKK